MQWELLGASINKLLKCKILGYYGLLRVSVSGFRTQEHSFPNWNKKIAKRVRVPKLRTLDSNNEAGERIRRSIDSTRNLATEYLVCKLINTGTSETFRFWIKLERANSTSP